ncbi:MAG: hypothetical protein V4699_01185 [Patescibacteria group bacterium]
MKKPETVPAPQTFEELMKDGGWKDTLRLLKEKKTTIRVMESPVAMGSYCAVILTGKGFQVESGRGGMSAAMAGSNPTVGPPIRSAAKVLEKVLDYNEPLDATDKRPSENEIVAAVLKAIEKIRKEKPVK